jgi:putative membrane protein
MQVLWILALCFGIVIAIFAVQNSTPVPISFLWFGVEAMAVSVLVLISAALGAIATLLLGMAREVRLRISRRSSQRSVQARDQRIAELEATVQRLEEENAELERQHGVAEPDLTEDAVLPAGSQRVLPPPAESEPRA